MAGCVGVVIFFPALMVVSLGSKLIKRQAGYVKPDYLYCRYRLEYCDKEYQKQTKSSESAESLLHCVNRISQTGDPECEDIKHSIKRKVEDILRKPKQKRSMAKKVYSNEIGLVCAVTLVQMMIL
ncbi:unnamed protein product [Lymnaea stagnalis]|uniref:Uncharacterized protein n=1 Tax=Lymnaea stagnalis TaxID=6523 RepID=A0AAV2HK31_LYMST